MARSREDSAHCYSNIAGATAHARTAKSKSPKKSLEYRTRQILGPNTLTADQFEGRWRGVTVMFVKEGNRVAGRSARNHETPILKFARSMMRVKLTRSQQRIWSLDITDDESSDAVQLKQVRPNGVHLP